MVWGVLGGSSWSPGQPERKHCLLLALDNFTSFRNIYSVSLCVRPGVGALDIEMAFKKGSSV